MGKPLGLPQSRRPAPRPPQTAGGGLPGVVAERELPDEPSISVICPTINRHGMHESLYRLFDAQDYAHKDLWILDHSATPSPFFRDRTDSRVHYVHRDGAGIRIGGARNQLLQMATGDVIAHFDDDDWYSHDYLSSMLAVLRHTDADLVKLARWNERRERDDRRWLFDGPKTPPNDLWGYGFTYVYRRYVATRVSYPATGIEDWCFIQGLWAAHLKTHLIHDGANWAEHVLHGQNTSRAD